MVFGEVDTREHCEDKSGSFPCATLTLCEEVAGRIREEDGQSLLLNLGGPVEPHSIHPFQQVWVPGGGREVGEGVRVCGSQAELLKCLDRVERRVWVVPLDLHCALSVDQLTPQEMVEQRYIRCGHLISYTHIHTLTHSVQTIIHTFSIFRHCISTGGWSLRL